MDSKDNDVEISILPDFGCDSVSKIKMARLWNELGLRIMKLPEWMRKIVLDDIQTAIRNRLAVMEMIEKCSNKR